MGREASEEKTKKGGLFDDLSATQVIAGALAAVTSMLLASQIGIAGSVIGVAVGSVVSAVASQLYKKFLAASADKLKDLHPVEIVTGAAQDGEGPSASPNELDSGGFAGRAAVLDDGERGGHLVGSGDASEKTAILNPVARRVSNTPNVDDAALQGDATVLRARSLRKDERRLQRRVAAVAVVSALVAVAVSAFSIYFVTNGEGFGAKVSTLPYVRSQPADSEAPSDGADGSDASQSDGSQENGASTPDDAKNDQSAGGAGDSSSGSTGDNQQGGSTDPSNPAEGGSQGTDSGSGNGTAENGGNQGSDNQGSGSSGGSSEGRGQGTDGGQSQGTTEGQGSASAG